MCEMGVVWWLDLPDNLPELVIVTKICFIKASPLAHLTFPPHSSSHHTPLCSHYIELPAIP